MPVIRKDQRPRIVVAPEWFIEETKYGQKLLGLMDWDITVAVKSKFKTSVGLCEGQCEPHDGHLTAKITYRQEVLRGEARYNVYHELAHLLFRNWDKADQKVADDMVAAALTAQVSETLAKGEEDACERFAHVIVRLLPPERKEPDGATS